MLRGPTLRVAALLQPLLSDTARVYVSKYGTRTPPPNWTPSRTHRTDSGVAAAKTTADHDLPFGTRETVYTHDQHHIAHTSQEVLATALRIGDYTRATSTWTALVQARLLGLVRVGDWSYYSAILEASEGEIPEDLPKQVVDALDSLAAHAAAAGYHGGVCSRMRSYISNGDPHPAIQLFVKTYKCTLQRAALFERQSTLSPTEHQELVRRFGSRPRLDYRVVAHVMTALTLKGSFQDGLRLFLHPSFSPSSKFMLSYSRLHQGAVVSTEDVLLRVKVVKYGKRLCLAVVLNGGRRRLSTMARWWEKRFEWGSPSIPDSSLKALLDELSNPDRSFIAFHPSSVSDQRPVLLDKDSEIWAVIMRLAFQYGYYTYAEQFQTRLQKIYGAIPPQVVAAKLDGLACSGKFDEVQATWEALCSGTGPDELPHTDICRAYISALFDEGRWDDAMHVFGAFLECVDRSAATTTATNTGHEASVLAVHHVVLEHLLRRSKADEAQLILSSMQRRGPRPSVASYNLFLRHFATVKQVEQLESIFTQLRSDGLHGDTETYSWLAVGLRTAYSDATHRVFEMMKADGALEVNGSTAGRMIKFLTTKDQNEDALSAAVAILDFLDPHMSGPLRPTEISIVQLQCAIERRVWEDPTLETLFREAMASVAQRHGRNILGRSLNAFQLIAACLENPTPAATRRAWQYYRKHAGPAPEDSQFLAGRYIPSGHIWVELLDAFRERREWALADLLVKELKVWRKITPVPSALLWSIKLAEERRSEPVNVATFNKDRLSDM